MLLRTVTADVGQHLRNLARLFVERNKASRVPANKYIQRLERDGWIARRGPSTHPVFALGYNRRISLALKIGFIAANKYCWKQALGGVDLALPFLAPNVRNIANHGFTEVLNNAEDHPEEKTRSFMLVRPMAECSSISQMMEFEFSIRLHQSWIELIRDKQYSNYQKQNLTTDPREHSVEDIFFASRMFDRFTIEANDLEFREASTEERFNW